MEVKIKLTNHKTTVLEQIAKVKEEYKEVNEELKNMNLRNAVDELFDLAKSSLKLADEICYMLEMDFNEKLKENNLKNEVRGYHDENR